MGCNSSEDLIINLFEEKLGISNKHLGQSANYPTV